MRNPQTKAERRLTGGTLFSGIGSPELAAPWVDWRWCAEIDPFASTVLVTRFFGRRNLGDVQSIPHTVEPVDLVVFGSPCQSFSVAGKRAGLDDPRGNLALIGLRVVERVRPRWVVFENVPGLLSSDGWRDFGTFLGALGQCGYGFAYRVLDAQFAGVPQRRRRVFVVGYLGDWRPAAAVLFEPESLSGDSPPRRETGQRIAASLAVGANRCGGRPGEFVSHAPTLPARSRSTGLDFDGGLVAFGGGRRSGAIDVATACTTSTRIDFETETLTLAIRGRGEFCDLEFRDDGTANALLTASGGRESHRAGCSLGSTAGSLTCGGGKAGEGGLDARFLKNRTLGQKVREIRGFHKRSFAQGDRARRRNLGDCLSKPFFRIRPKGNHQANASLACYFEQIVR